MKQMLLLAISSALMLYILVCAWLYFDQEALLFHPRRLPAGYQFAFAEPHTEFVISTADGQQLSGVLFRAGAAKGLVFFLHGNGGSLAEWGALAPGYTRLGYDVFMLDYRGYGKSTGTIGGQAQLLADVEAAYQKIAPAYAAQNIVIAGYSLGTGPAAWLAARHPPQLLLLHAPYYSMADMAAHTVAVWPLLPGWLLRYPLPTNEFLPKVTAPVVLVHGDRDALIPYESSVRLRALLKPTDQLITLAGAGHNGLLGWPQYQTALRQLLR